MLVLALVAMVVCVALPRYGCGPWWQLAALILIGLHPSLITAARSVRFEQEIALTGTLGALILPTILYTGKFIRIRYLLWLLSGLCCSWAGCTHPWGGVFPVVLLAHLTWYRRDWRAADGLPWFSRMVLLGIGALLPIAATVLPMLHDPRIIESM